MTSFSKMRAGSHIKTKSVFINWRQIVVEVDGEIFIYDLNDKERLVQKMERQKKRTLKKDRIAQQAQQAQQNQQFQFNFNGNTAPSVAKNNDSTQKEVSTASAEQAASTEKGISFDIFEDLSLAGSENFYNEKSSEFQEFLNSIDWMKDEESIFDFFD